MSKSLQCKVLLIAIAMALTACSYRSENNLLEFERIVDVQVNQAFNNLPNGSYLYFQNGANVPVRRLDKWSGYCSLYVYDENYEAEHINSIRPGSFRITAISNGREVVENRLLHDSTDYLIASLRWEHDHIPSYIDYQLRVDLYAADQSAVRRLLCNQRSGSFGDYYPTLAQIRQNLGDIIQIAVNGL